MAKHRLPTCFHQTHLSDVRGAGMLRSGFLVLLPLASALLSAPATTRHLGRPRAFSPTGFQPAARAFSLPTRTPPVFMQEVVRAAPPSTRHSRVGWFAQARSCGRRALLAAGAFALMTPRLAFASVGAVPLQGRILYALQQAVVRNAGLAVAVFFATAVLTGGWLFFKVNPDSGSLGEATYQAYSLLNDIPGADCSATPNALSRLLATSLHITGVFTFAVVLGIVSDGISTKIDSARLSNEPVLESRHTVLLNWGEYTRPVLRQLEAARREGRISGPVVIIADRDKEEMDAMVKDELDKLQPRAKLSVTTRTGSPSELSSMQRVAAGTAQRIIVTQPDNIEPDDYARQYKESAALALSLQESAEPNKPAKRAHVVVGAPRGVTGGFVHGERCVGEGCSETSGFASYAEVAPVDFVSRLLAQCTAQPGLSRVYQELFEQGKGAELYAEPVAKSLVGRPFGEAWRYFERATPLGVLTAGGEVLLSPEDSLVFAKGDEIVLLADTAQACRPTTSLPPTPTPTLTPTPTPAPTPTPTLTVTLTVTLALTLTAQACRACRAPLRSPEAPDAAAATAQPAEKLAPKRLLLLGWNPQMPDLLAQIDEVSATLALALALVFALAATLALAPAPALALAPIPAPCPHPHPHLPGLTAWQHDHDTEPAGRRPSRQCGEWAAPLPAGAGRGGPDPCGGPAADAPWQDRLDPHLAGA